MIRNVGQSVSLLLFGFTIVMVSGLSSSNIYAVDVVVDEINISVPVSCTMSGSGMNTHNAEISNGTYEDNIGMTTIKAFCNDSAGFAVYAIGYTDNEDGKNVLTNENLGNAYNINTGTATSGDDSNWAMKIGKLTNPTPIYPIIIAGSDEDSLREQGDLDRSVYQAVPNDYTKIAYRTTSTDVNLSDQSTVEGAALTTTYQAYISKTQPAGTYSGQVKYTLVHPHNTVKPEMPSTTCRTAFPNITYMQEINPSNLSAVLISVDENSLYYLRDKRDNQPYCVAKLSDGKLWMLENLNIAGGTELSSTDTDFESTYTLPTTNGWTANGDKLVLPLSAAKNDNNNNLVDSASFSKDNYAYVFNSNNKENCGASGQNRPCYSYYSWDSVTLGSGRTLNEENKDAPYSICPKGWKLPTSGGASNEGWKRGDFYALSTSYGADLSSNNQDASSNSGANFYNNAGPGTDLNYLLSGYYMAGTSRNLGGYGLYWSATSAYNTGLARSLALGTNFVDSANYASRRSGFAVRCVASQ